MSEKPILCVCGHRKELHDNPGCEINGGCAGGGGDLAFCRCGMFRPVLDWPDGVGWWIHLAAFCNAPYCFVYAGWNDLKTELLIVTPGLEGTSRKSDYKPGCRFTRCLEPNPFDH